MLSFLRWIFSTILIVLAVVFALGNREMVNLTFSPVHDPITMPLYVVGLGLAVIGFILGAIATWIGSHATRRDLRLARKQAKTLEKEIADIKNKAPAAPEPPTAITYTS